MPGQAFGGSPGDHRPRVLPREVGGRSCRNRRHPGGDREDAHVLCAQEALGASQGARNRSRLAMNAMKQEAPERQEIEELLPWHAAGTLNRRDAQRVEEALARDAEPARRRATPVNLGTRISEFFASLSPRTLAWSASAAALAILLQAGFLAGIVLNETKTSGYQTASAPTADPSAGAFALIRFAPQ